MRLCICPLTPFDHQQLAGLVPCPAGGKVGAAGHPQHNKGFLSPTQRYRLTNGRSAVPLVPHNLSVPDPQAWQHLGHWCGAEIGLSHTPIQEPQ